ncbi:MAG: hypothetical protein AAF443_01425 [Chlamydiota bacterium]
MTSLSKVTFESNPLEQIDGDAAPSSIIGFFESPGRAFIGGQWVCAALDRVWSHGKDWVNFPTMMTWFSDNDAVFAISSFLNLGNEITQLLHDATQGSLVIAMRSTVYLVGMVNKVVRFFPKVGILQPYAEGMKKVGGYTGVFYHTGSAIDRGWKGEYCDCIQSIALAAVNLIGLIFAEEQKIPILGCVIPSSRLQFLAFTCFVAAVVAQYFFFNSSVREDSSEDKESKTWWKAVQKHPTDFLIASRWLIDTGKQINHYKGSNSDYIDLSRAGKWASHADALMAIPKLAKEGYQLVDCVQSENKNSNSWGTFALRMIKVSGRVTKLTLSMGLLEQLGKMHLKTAKWSFSTISYMDQAYQSALKKRWARVSQDASLAAFNALHLISYVWELKNLHSLKYLVSTAACISYAYDRFYGRHERNKSEENIDFDGGDSGCC